MAGTMAYDEKKIEMAVLALLYYGSFERPGNRSAWKTYDWAITERLFEQGLIGDPRGTSKSIVFTPEGEVRAKAAFEALFDAGSPPGGGRPAKAKKGKRARSDYSRCWPAVQLHVRLLLLHTPPCSIWPRHS